MAPGETKERVPTWLNDDLLLTAVRKGERDPCLKLVSSHIEFDNAQGDHYASTMFKVKVRVARDLSPEEEKQQKDVFMIIKTLPKGELVQDLMVGMGVFTREIKMFSETLPAIRRLFDSRGCREYQDIGARYFHHSTENSVLIVENLAPKGFRMAKRQVGLDLNHSMLVMRLLAKYHAASIVLRVEEPELIESYPPKHSFFNQNEGFETWINTSLKGIASVVLSWPNGEFYSKKILERMKTYKDDYLKSLEYDPEGFNVLIHGDLWMGNMLFRYDDLTNDVKEVKFVDFQISCINSAAIDLQYFIHTSPTEEVRTAHTDDLLKEYHRTLCDTLGMLGHHQKSISFERLMEEYNKKWLQAVFGMLLVFPIVVAKPEDAMDTEKILRDNDADSTLINRLTGEYITKVHKKYIPLFIEKGLI